MNIEELIITYERKIKNLKNGFNTSEGVRKATTSAKLVAARQTLNELNSLRLDFVSDLFFYHKENEEVGKVFRNTITDKWYYSEELAEIIGWANVHKLESK